VPGDELSDMKQAAFDLVLSMFTFDNIPGRETKIRIFREWASFSTHDFPENPHRP
jgi:hypothetical protein